MALYKYCNSIMGSIYKVSELIIGGFFSEFLFECFSLRKVPLKEWVQRVLSLASVKFYSFMPTTSVQSKKYIHFTM